MPSFYKAIETSVFATLNHGLHGWPVTDCKVRLVKLGHVKPISQVADFKGLVPILLLKALQQAQTQIYEPCQAFELEIPDNKLGDILGFLTANEAQVKHTQLIGQNPLAGQRRDAFKMRTKNSQRLAIFKQWRSTFHHLTGQRPTL